MELKLQGGSHVNIEEKWFLCHTCLNTLRKSKTQPKLSYFNGLEVEPIPDTLQLTEIENQLIAITILFMKIKLLNKSRMPAMVDRTILVPIEDTEVLNNVEALPRTPEEGAVVPVKLKRMKGLKNSHAQAYVRPGVLFKALATLKSIGNPFLHTYILA